jgi:hypothetical protein
MRATARSASASVGALVLPDGILGMADASITLNPDTPRTRSFVSSTAIASSSRPIDAVPTEWSLVFIMRAQGREERAHDVGSLQPSRCLARRVLHDADAILPLAVEVRVVTEAAPLRGEDEILGRSAMLAGIVDVERPVDAVKAVVEACISLHASKMRKHVAPGPAGIPAEQAIPVAVVLVLAPHVHHR